MREPVDSVDVAQLQLHLGSLQVVAMSEEQEDWHEGDDHPAYNSPSVTWLLHD